VNTTEPAHPAIGIGFAASLLNEFFPEVLEIRGIQEHLRFLVQKIRLRLEPNGILEWSPGCLFAPEKRYEFE
jgi:hypothetical protein